MTDNPSTAENAVAISPQEASALIDVILIATMPCTGPNCLA
jgi:hypothetical protein